MKFISYFLLLLLSACSTAQNLKVIEAVHYTRIGGVKGSRAEIFEIKLKDHLNWNVKYLMMGEVEIPLSTRTENGIMILTGTYFPEDPNGIQLGETSAPLKLDSNEAYLVIENPSTKKISQQKISFSNIDQPMMNNDVPE